MNLIEGPAADSQPSLPPQQESAPPVAPILPEPAKLELAHPSESLAKIEPSDTAIPQPEPVEVDAATESWPRWFWAGLAATLAISALIIVVRMALNDDSGPSIVAQTRPAVDQDATPPPESPANGASAQTPSAENQTVESSEPIEPSNANHAPAAAPSAEQAVQPPPPPASVAEAPPRATVDPPVADPPPVAAAAPVDQAGIDAPPVVPQQRTILRVPPRPVNVDAMLAETIPAIDVRGMPLARLLALVSKLSAIPITLEADALTVQGRSADVPVTIRLDSPRVSELLEAVLEPLGLSYRVADGQVIVGFATASEMRRVQYTVTDLATNDDELAALGALVRRMVAPDSWQEAGGRGTLTTGGSTLSVEQDQAGHLELLTFCEKLRVARGLPLRSRYEPARFKLESRSARASGLLTKQLTANFSEPAPLGEVVDWLAKASGATILINHAALARAGMSSESECSAIAIDRPLASVLDELLSPLELTWRAVDERAIEITTRQAAAEHLDVELYPVRDLAADEAAGKALVAQLTSQIEETGSSIAFDVPGRTLIVRAPYRLQAEIEAELTRRRAANAGTVKAR